MFEGHHQAISDLLAARGLAAPDRETLLQAVADHLGLDYAAGLPGELPAGVVASLSGELARAYGVVPLSGDDRSMAVAAADPFDPNLAGDLAFALGRAVRVSVADPDGVRRLIRQHYGAEDPTPGTAREKLPSGEPALTDADIDQLAGQTPVIRFVNLVLAQAIRDHASDIHFEPFEHEFKIRYRIDGVLHEMAPPPRDLALPVISRLKVLANLNIAERRLPQDGRIQLHAAGRPVDLRVSSLPTQFGESVVLRVLDQSSVRLDLGQLGLPDPIRAGLEDVIRRPNGIFVVTGPTGSGKTTTLYSCLKELNRVDSKLLTVEDPVEYEIDGVMQVPVNWGAGLTFARALRTFLRQDPDIVMVGEIRDLETARIALQASLTGHLVLSTLHTNDGPSAVTRLLDLGVEPFLLGSTLEAVLAQRLVRRVCAVCRVPYEPDEALCRQLGVEPAVIAGRPFHRAGGCPACHHTGYGGRLGIFEFLPMTESLREQVVKGVSLVEVRRRAVEQGMTPLRDAGLAAILAGDTTVEEVIKYT